MARERGEPGRSGQQRHGHRDAAHPPLAGVRGGLGDDEPGDRDRGQCDRGEGGRQQPPLTGGGDERGRPEQRRGDRAGLRRPRVGVGAAGGGDRQRVDAADRQAQRGRAPPGRAQGRRGADGGEQHQAGGHVVADRSRQHQPCGHREDRQGERRRHETPDQAGSGGQAVRSPLHRTAMARAAPTTAATPATPATMTAKPAKPSTGPRRILGGSARIPSATSRISNAPIASALCARRRAAPTS